MFINPFTLEKNNNNQTKIDQQPSSSYSDKVEQLIKKDDNSVRNKIKNIPNG